MKNKRLLERFGDIDEKYILRAEAAEKKRKGRLRGWAALAAAVVLVTAVGIWAIPQMRQEGPALPVLSVSDFSFGGGYEGHGVYDIAELVNGNPWCADMELTTLPVYRDRLWDTAYIGSDQFQTEMCAFAEELAARLGVQNVTAQIDENGHAVITQPWVKISVDTTACVMMGEIRFDPAISLPKDYDFSRYASYESVQAAADRIVEQFAPLLAMENPVACIEGGGYNTLGKQKYSVSFYEDAETDLDRILAYNFGWMTVSRTDEGKVWILRFKRIDLSEKVGDYPIITPDEAEALLLDGRYITTVMLEDTSFLTAQRVGKTELVYRTDGHDGEYYLPYYRFYVELPMEHGNGMKTYGAYYVPAVEGQYIENMPLWDGSFN